MNIDNIINISSEKCNYDLLSSNRKSFCIYLKENRLHIFNVFQEIYNTISLPESFGERFAYGESWEKSLEYYFPFDFKYIKGEKWFDLIFKNTMKISLKTQKNIFQYQNEYDQGRITSPKLIKIKNYNGGCDKNFLDSFEMLLAIQTGIKRNMYIKDTLNLAFACASVDVIKKNIVKQKNNKDSISVSLNNYDWNYFSGNYDCRIVVSQEENRIIDEKNNERARKQKIANYRKKLEQQEEN